MCNKSYKQGKDACNSRVLPKDKIERLVIDQVKDKVLTELITWELVKATAEFYLNDEGKME